MASTFSGPARTAVVAVGQRTGWSLRHLDGAINPTRSNLMPDIDSGNAVVFESSHDGSATAIAYHAAQRGDGQPLGQHGFQRLFMVPIALNNSMWSPTVRNEQSNILPVNKRRGVYACLLYTSPSPRDQRGSRMPSSA